MSFITDEILKVIQEFNLEVEVVNREGYQTIFQNIVAMFLDNNPGYPLWESIVDKASIRDANAWTLLPQFVEDGVILFLEKEDARFAVIFKQSHQLQILLENSFHFVFYITNPLFEFLLCFNDHDYLIGSGSAKKWITDLNI
jgi:hypothetical protein